MIIVIPDDQPSLIADSPALARLREQSGAEIRLFNTRPSDEASLLDRIQGAHTAISIRASTLFTRHVIEGSRELRHLAIWGPGVDNVDLDAARRMNVTVTNTPDTATEAVAEHCLALLLALARKVPELDSRVRRGEWPRGLLTQLSGNTLGIMGTGQIGKRLAVLGRGIGMNVIAWTRRPDQAWADANGVSYVEFDDILRDADAISLHLRLSPDTRGLIGSEQLARMKPTALIVNVARGGLIDEAALAEALRDGVIAGAALDTFTREPLQAGSPLVEIPNLILSPHTAGTTAEALAQSLEMVVENALSYLSGRVENRVGV
jgi:D-3-phosphoglycerate dehydrogenase / 2-oxoglutarate reductase